ncbi:MAG: deoxynucleoside kinase [Flammeovirgaceae bacterium]|nr:deoxynucleoside kinase [Flammeovirgaceae bacterium]
MKKKLKHIAIAGNIGVGKTSLAKILSKNYNWKLELESVKKNPYLSDFYEDMEKWSFHLQIYFLNNRFEQNQKILKSKNPVIQDRTIYEDEVIFTKNLYESGFLKKREYNNYLKLFNSIIKYVKPPDLIIYLRNNNIGKLVNNIEKRDRVFEKSIQIQYLKNLHLSYEKWIKNYSLNKILIIDVTELDFIKKREDLEFVVDKINIEVNGLF